MNGTEHVKSNNQQKCGVPVLNAALTSLSQHNADNETHCEHDTKHRREGKKVQETRDHDFIAVISIVS